MTSPLVPVVQAGINALAAWLSAGLPPYVDATQPGVLVSQEWPSPDAPLPLQALTILRAGDPTEEATEPTVQSYEVIHDEISAKIIAATVEDDATAILAANACRASYEAQRVAIGAHDSADTENALVKPVATDQDSAIELANDLRANVILHFMSAAHVTVDNSTALATVPIATNAASLYVLATALLNELNRHYVARLYTWRLAEIEQDVQLDCWSTSMVWRDDLMARLEPLLNAGAAASASFTYDDPVRHGVILPLANGWSGYVDYDFEQTAPVENPVAIQQNEYRATVHGRMSIFRLVKAQSARLAIAQMQLTANERPTQTTATVSWSASGIPTESFT